MSSPIPALNPARYHDHPIPVAAVVPLSRRAQQSTDAPAEESLDSVALPEERADPAHELPDDLPVADGNLFVAGSVVVAPRAMPLGNALPLPADTRGPGWRRPDDAAAGAGRAASGRYVLPMRAPAERPAHAAPQPDASVPGGDDNPGHTQGSPLRTPAPAPLSPDVAPAFASVAKHPLAAQVDPHLPARGPAAATPLPATVLGPLSDDRVVEPATSPQHQTLQPASEKLTPLLHAAGHAPAPLHADGARRPGGSLPTAKPDPARTELPAAVPAPRIATVSVPFSSWGPGHHVTASWVPVAVSGQLPSMTLRSTSESAQRAIGSALAASDPLAAGGLQLTAADSADDGTSGRRQAPDVPEDEE